MYRSDVANCYSCLLVSTSPLGTVSVARNAGQIFAFSGTIIQPELLVDGAWITQRCVWVEFKSSYMEISMSQRQFTYRKSEFVIIHKDSLVTVLAGDLC